MEVVKADGKERDQNLYKPITKLPAPFKKFNLTADQKYYYKYFGNELLATNVLAKVDLIHLHNLAVGVSLYQDAITEMNKKGNGIVQTFTSGAKQISPYLTAMKSAIGIINNVSKHFGFSFADRYNLNAISSGDPNQTKMDLWKNFDDQKSS